MITDILFDHTFGLYHSCDCRTDQKGRPFKTYYGYMFFLITNDERMLVLKSRDDIRKLSTKVKWKYVEDLTEQLLECLTANSMGDRVNEILSNCTTPKEELWLEVVTKYKENQ